jgi:hypothetical protein
MSPYERRRIFTQPRPRPVIALERALTLQEQRVGHPRIACSVESNFAQQMRENMALSPGVRLASFDPYA